MEIAHVANDKPQFMPYQTHDRDKRYTNGNYQGPYLKSSNSLPASIMLIEVLPSN